MPLTADKHKQGFCVVFANQKELNANPEGICQKERELVRTVLCLCREKEYLVVDYMPAMDWKYCFPGKPRMQDDNRPDKWRKEKSVCR